MILANINEELYCQVDEDWPIVILDHDYNEHSVIMKPGDMLLYESAKSLHGRTGTQAMDLFLRGFVIFSNTLNLYFRRFQRQSL